MKFKFQCQQIKFYWNPAVPFICVLSRTPFAPLRRAELVPQRLHGTQCIKYSLSGVLQKRLPSPGIKKEKKDTEFHFSKVTFFSYFSLFYFYWWRRSCIILIRVFLKSYFSLKEHNPITVKMDSGTKE